MPTIKIDGKEYDSDTLSKEAKTQLVSLQLTEGEIKRLEMQLAIAKTARNAYAKALRDALQRK